VSKPHEKLNWPTMGQKICLYRAMGDKNRWKRLAILGKAKILELDCTIFLKNKDFEKADFDSISILKPHHGYYLSEIQIPLKANRNLINANRRKYERPPLPSPSPTESTAQML
jgi:hypothetical protein